MYYAKKSLGQNFLKDKNIIKKIVNLVKVENKNIIEIGPGEGALTNEILLRKPKSLLIIEKDNNLAKDLSIKYYDKKTIEVHNLDILKFNIEEIIKDNVIIFGYLPYNISSQILVKILNLNWPTKIQNIIFMFQKELGEKILGKFLTTNYGRLSILSNFKLNLIEKFLISPNCFLPKPKVTSMLIHFKPKKKLDFKIKNLKNLEKITNILFSNKRKMVNKNIKKILSEKQIKKIKDLKLNKRPSELKPEIYYKIAEIYETK